MSMITREHKRLDNYRMDMADGSTALGDWFSSFFLLHPRLDNGTSG